MSGARAKLGLICVLLALAALGSHLSSASFTATKSNSANSFTAAGCFGGTSTVSASQDSYVDNSSANSNFGTNSSLLVATNTTILATRKRTLVKFSLPALTGTCAVTSATLTLYDSSPTSGRTIDCLRLNGSWTETGVTWNNQPSTTGSAASSSSPSSAGTQSWSVTSEVQAMYSGTNNGFLLMDSSETALLSLSSHQQTYQAREGTPDARDPVLSITIA